MKKNTFLGIAGLALMGFASCGGSEDCAPAGTWSVTSTPQTGDTCTDAAETSSRVVTVMGGNATITDPSDGSSVSGGLDSSCHMGWVTAISSSDVVAAGSSEVTFTGSTLAGTVNAHATFTADNSMCTVKLKLVGVRL